MTSSDGVQYCAYAHDALYDDNPEQKESILSTHHALTNISTGIDDRSISERDIYGRPGTECARFGEMVLLFYFDGVKCFLEVGKLNANEFSTLPRVDLTPDKEYNPVH